MPANVSPCWAGLCLRLDDGLCLVVFHDASWGNAEAPPELTELLAGLSEQGKTHSQAGYLVYLCERQVLQGQVGYAALLEWRSHTLRRVTRSTFAAETLACAEGLDAADVLRGLMVEILYPSFPMEADTIAWSQVLPILAVTDCKSLYDCLVRDGPQNSLSEKRLAVDIVGLQDVAAAFDEENPKETIRWNPYHKQLADCMTRRTLPYKLREILERGSVSLVADDGNDFTMKAGDNSYACD